MELHQKIIEIIDRNLIYYLIPMTLTLIFIELCFKNRFETKKVLNLIRWTIITYAAITWSLYLIGISLNPDKYAFIDRATGPYAWAYWMMFFSSLILPFTLLSKKLASKFFYVLIVAFAIKLGMYFEYFVIIITSLHRDYLPKSETVELIDMYKLRIGIKILQAVAITVLTLGIFEISKSRKNYTRAH